MQIQFFLNRILKQYYVFLHLIFQLRFEIITLIDSEIRKNYFLILVLYTSTKTKLYAEITNLVVAYSSVNYLFAVKSTQPKISYAYSLLRKSTFLPVFLGYIWKCEVVL